MENQSNQQPQSQPQFSNNSMENQNDQQPQSQLQQPQLQFGRPNVGTPQIHSLPPPPQYTQPQSQSQPQFGVPRYTQPHSMAQMHRPQSHQFQHGAGGGPRMHPSVPSVPTRHQMPPPQYGPVFPGLPGVSAHRPYHSQYGVPPTMAPGATSQNPFPNMPQHPSSSRPSYPDSHQIWIAIHQLEAEAAALRARIAELEKEVAMLQGDLIPEELLPPRKRGRLLQLK